MPSYLVFNHKTGSVSSNYSTTSTFSNIFDLQLHSDRSGGRPTRTASRRYYEVRRRSRLTEPILRRRRVLFRGEQFPGLQLNTGHDSGTVGGNGSWESPRHSTDSARGSMYICIQACVCCICIVSCLYFNCI
jgi:hypothetical protein